VSVLASEVQGRVTFAFQLYIGLRIVTQQSAHDVLITHLGGDHEGRQAIGAHNVGMQDGVLVNKQIILGWHQDHSTDNISCLRTVHNQRLKIAVSFGNHKTTCSDVILSTFTETKAVESRKKSEQTGRIVMPIHYATDGNLVPVQINLQKPQSEVFHMSF